MTFINLLTICYNEEKTIRQFLEHYSFCTSITIYDNKSTDRTVELIKKHRPDAIIVEYDTNDEIDNKKFLDIKNNVWKGSEADWQIVVDCDEFILNPYRADSITSYLEMLQKRGVTLIPTIGYNAHFDSFREDFHQSFQEASFAPIYGKYCIFNPKKIKEMNYKIGAHECSPEGEIVLTNPHLYMLHFKYFGFNDWKIRNSEYASRVKSIPGAFMYQHYKAEVRNHESYKQEFEQNRMDLLKLFTLKGSRKK